MEHTVYSWSDFHHQRESNLGLLDKQASTYYQLLSFIKSTKKSFIAFAY